MNKSILFFLGIVALSLPARSQQYLAILKRGALYKNDTIKKPEFTYQSPGDSNLVAFRKNYKLDSIAGFGNETSRVLNLLHYVHNTVNHNGSVESGITGINGPAIITAANTRHIGVSCGELATVLNDCFLAMGVPSRKIYCFPKDSLHQDHDSHVINAVYISGKKKWVWLDPTNDAYVMDESGELLGIEEVRERLVNDKLLIVNPDANWNRRVSTLKSEYLYNYMAKNLYRFHCPLNSKFDYETQGKGLNRTYVHLIPAELPSAPFNKNFFDKPQNIRYVNYSISNPSFFWQVPNGFTKE